MKAYSYDSITKEYRNDTECQINPLETIKQGRDVFLLPASATLEKPPASNINEKSVYDNNTWVIKKDYRGIYYDKITKEKQVIDTIGELKNSNWTNKIPLAFDDTCKWSGTKWIIDDAKIAEIEKNSEKEKLIQDKIRIQAIDALKVDGIFDANGDLI